MESKKMRQTTKNTIIGVIVGIVVAAILGFLIVASFSSKSEPDLVINPSVVAYDQETSPFKILASDKDSVTVSSLEGIQDDTILCAGISEQTPYGLLRKIAASEPVDDGYKITTTPAALTEAIEKCDTVVTAYVGENGTYEILKEVGTKNEEPENFWDNLLGVKQAHAFEATFEGVLPLVDTSSKEFPFSNLVDLCMENIFEVRIKIESGELEMGVTNHLKAQASIGRAAAQGTVDIFKAPLPTFEFAIGFLPVVITNEISGTFNYDHQFNDFFPVIETRLDKKIGYTFSSINGLAPINEDKSQAPMLQWNPEADISLVVNDSISVSYLGKIYDFAGPEFSVGIANNLQANLQALALEKPAKDAILLFDKSWAGKLTNKATVPIEGKFVLELPDILKFFTGYDRFAEIGLFNTGDLITLRDDKWSTTDDMFGIWSFVYIDETNTAPDPIKPDIWVIGDDGTAVNEYNGLQLTQYAWKPTNYVSSSGYVLYSFTIVKTAQPSEDKFLPERNKHKRLFYFDRETRMLCTESSLNGTTGEMKKYDQPTEYERSSNSDWESEMKTYTQIIESERSRLSR